VGEVELVGVNSVVGHQEPARTAGFHLMHPVARRRLGSLVELILGVALEDVVKRGSGQCHTAQRGRTHALRSPRDLDDALQGHRLGTKERGKPGHPLAARRTDLDSTPIRQDLDERGDAPLWEVHIQDRAPRLDEDFAT
jgi:hypothetical protein